VVRLARLHCSSSDVPRESVAARLGEVGDRPGRSKRHVITRDRFVTSDDASQIRSCGAHRLMTARCGSGDCDDDGANDRLGGVTWRRQRGIIGVEEECSFVIGGDELVTGDDVPFGPTRPGVSPLSKTSRRAIERHA